MIIITSILLSLANTADLIAMIASLGTFRSGMALEVPVALLRMGSVFISLIALIGTTSRANRNNAAKINSVLEANIVIAKNKMDDLSKTIHKIDNVI